MIWEREVHFKSHILAPQGFAPYDRGEKSLFTALWEFSQAGTGNVLTGSCTLGLLVLPSGLHFESSVLS